MSVKVVSGKVPPFKYLLNERQVNDLEMILTQAFYPLDGFMRYDDYVHTINNDTLADGTVWPIPVVLAIPKIQFRNDEEVYLIKDYNTTIELIDPKFPESVAAKIHIESIYEPDLMYECQKVLGTTDINHPYVKYVNSNTDVYYVGGKVEKVEGVKHYDFVQYRHTPKSIKNVIDYHNYERVLGFQTRNPMHNCHYTLSKYTYDEIDCGTESGTETGSGSNISNKKLLLLQPVVGVTQNDDVEYHTRVRCYVHLLSKYYTDKVNVKLCLLPLSMRMAGPKEALLHAIIRQNYGCTDFVIGRDHAGPSTKRQDGRTFYEPYDAHDYVSRFKDRLKINIHKSVALVYSPTLDKYTTINNVPDKQYLELSGTELRRKLKNRENIPDWFTLPAIAKELQIAYNISENRGLCIYLIGLSGAGKTTLSQALKYRLMEKFDESRITVLDGDVIRENLSQGLGFDKQSRSINVRRIGYVASLITKLDGIVLCANIAPYDEDRLYNRKLIESTNGRYVEVFVDTPISECERRDVKGLYKKARSGAIPQFTGVTDPFERPSKPDIIVNGIGDINKTLDVIMEYLF